MSTWRRIVLSAAFAFVVFTFGATSLPADAASIPSGITAGPRPDPAAVLPSKASTPSPVISVSPTSLSATLHTEGIESRVLTIGNIGPSDLRWSAAIRGDTAKRSYTLSPMPPVTCVDTDHGLPPPTAPQAVGTELTTELRDLAGVRVMWDASHGQGQPTNCVAMIDDLALRGVEVVVNMAPITTASLTGFDVLWSVECYANWTPAEANALAAWLHAGGGLLLEGDNTSSVGFFNSILSATGVGIVFVAGAAQSGTMTQIFPHETTAGIDALYLMGPTAHLSSITVPAQVLVQDVTNTPVVAWSESGRGRVLVMCDEMLTNWELNYEDNRLFGNQVFDWLAPFGWLQIEPCSGTVAAGESQDVTATFDAMDLCDNALVTRIALTSNDLITPETGVRAAVVVLQEPDITITPASLEFGTHYLGSVATDTVTVSNQGCDLLKTSLVSTDNAEFLVSPAGPFEVAPGETQILVLTYLPTTTGPVAGVLTVASNDHSDPAVSVPLSGTGEGPPVIIVTPDSFSVAIEPGGITARTLTIGNVGQSGLSWSTALRSEAKLHKYTLPPMVATVEVSSDPGPHSPPSRLANGIELTADLRDLSGVRIMWDAHHGQVQLSSWADMFGDLELRGARVIVNTAPITPELLNACDIFWTTDCSSTWTGSETSALSDWVHSGGGLLLEGDNDTSIPAFNSIMSAAGAGIMYSTADASNGSTARIFPHETTQDIESLYLNSPIARLSAVNIPAQVLVQDAAGAPVAAWSVIDEGRVIALSDEYFVAWGLNGDDNRLFGNQVFDWLANYIWLEIEPTAGTVPASGTRAVNVTFDATHICGGFLNTQIVVTSNDIHRPEIAVTTSFDVLGVQDIEIAPPDLDFGTAHVGSVTTETLTVRNAGCEQLTVNSVTSDNNAFTTSPSGPFTLEPDMAQIVVVSHTTATIGTDTGSLNVVSDDPDEPACLVPMTAKGVTPPSITVAPDSLSVSLEPDETATRSFTICNAGQCALSWSATATTAIVPSAFTQRINDNDLLTHVRPRILLMSPYDPAGDAHGRALQRLGLSYTLVSDWEMLLAALTNNGPWGLVIVNNFNSYGASLPVLDALVTHLDNNGSLIFTDWSIYCYSSHLLLSRLGILLQDTPTTPLNFSAVDSNHRCFQHPNVIRDLHWNLDQFSYEGHIVAVLPGSHQLAAFQGHPRSGAVVLNPMGRTIFNGFLTANYTADDDGDGLRDIVELAENEIVLVGVGATWLTVMPESGVVPAGGSQVVAVAFDAAAAFDDSDPCGGDLAAQINVTSNDPTTPDVTVAALLDVTGMPNITTAPALLNFGPLHIGAFMAKTLTVTNTGCEPLSIHSISANDSQFSALPTSPLTLAPGTSRTVTVTFTPESVGSIASVLTIVSDDPFEPTITLPLSGSGVPPPVIEVSPDSLSASLSPDTVSSQILSIDNNGFTDLNWSAHTSIAYTLITQLRGTHFTTRDYQSAIPVSLSGDNNDASAASPNFDKRIYSSKSSVPITARILIMASYQPTDDAYGLALQRLGLSHTMVTNELDLQDELTDNGPWDMVIVNNYLSPMPASCLNALVNHLNQDGALIYADWAMYYYANHNLLTQLGVSYQSTLTTPLDIVSIDYDHHCFGWPNEIHELHWNENQFTRDGQIVEVLAGAHHLAAFQDHPGAGAIVLNATGRTIFNGFQAANFTADDDGDGLRDVVELAENEIVLIGIEAPWLSAVPNSGVIVPGGSQDVTVTFDGAGLHDGEYLATIVLQSNDPISPAVIVPTNLTVIGTLPLSPFPTPKQSQDKWSVTVRLRGSGSQIILGQSIDATDGFDLTWDLPSPPASPAKMTGATISLPRPHWAPAYGELFLSDIRAPGGQALVFTAQVTASEPCIIGLCWDCFDLPDGRDMAIRSGDRTLVASMRAQGGVELHVGNAPFELEFATVDTIPSSWVASGLQLHNRPNPFNPSTRLHFILPVDGQTEAVIYDMRGIIVQRIQAGRLPAGPASLNWDGIDLTGHQVASGVYLYRLFQDDHQLGQTQKMVLVK